MRKALKLIVLVNLVALPEMAKTYNINTSAISRQLPTLILFEDGKEISRFPPYDDASKRYMRVEKYSKVSLLLCFQGVSNIFL